MMHALLVHLFVLMFLVMAFSTHHAICWQRGRCKVCTRLGGVLNMCSNTSPARAFMHRSNFSSTVNGGIYHFNPHLAQRINVTHHAVRQVVIQRRRSQTEAGVLTLTCFIVLRVQGMFEQQLHFPPLRRISSALVFT